MNVLRRNPDGAHVPEAAGVPLTRHLGRIADALFAGSAATGWADTARIVTAPPVNLPAIGNPLAKTMTLRDLEELRSLPEAS